MLSKIELQYLESPEQFAARYRKVLRHRIKAKILTLTAEMRLLTTVTDFSNLVTEFRNPIAGNSEKERSPNQPAFGEMAGARGGIRTHGGLRQRILSPPPCLRLVFWPALPI